MKDKESITREEILAPKTISLEKRRKFKVIYPDYINMRQDEIRLEEYILTAFKKAKNNPNMLLQEAFEREINTVNKPQYRKIMKYIDYILDRLSTTNKDIYNIRKNRKSNGVIDFDDLSSKEINELFRLFEMKIEEI